MTEPIEDSDFWGEEPGKRIDYRKTSIKEMSNARLVTAIKQLHFFRYKTPEQTVTYNTLMTELTRREKSGTI